uniref:Retrotransposon gag domain-containing protein n=2 Tax=Capitella teleta TaxID=283909 RepID=X1ZZB7_CAPTE
MPENSDEASVGDNRGARRAPARFSAPAEFSFRPDDWPRWLTRYNRYRSAGRMDEEEGDRQVDALLYTMGEESENIFANLSLTMAQRVKYEDVTAAFTTYYAPRKNRTFERKRFHETTQESKTIEEYERELHAASKHCEFVDLTDQ